MTDEEPTKVENFLGRRLTPSSIDLSKGKLPIKVVFAILGAVVGVVAGAAVAWATLQSETSANASELRKHVVDKNVHLDPEQLIRGGGLATKNDVRACFQAFRIILSHTEIIDAKRADGTRSLRFLLPAEDPK